MCIILCIALAAAWEAIVVFANARRALPSEGGPYRWRREDAYEERETRFPRAS